MTKTIKQYCQSDILWDFLIIFGCIMNNDRMIALKRFFKPDFCVFRCYEKLKIAWFSQFLAEKGLHWKNWENMRTYCMQYSVQSFHLVFLGKYQIFIHFYLLELFCHPSLNNLTAVNWSITNLDVSKSKQILSHLRIRNHLVFSRARVLASYIPKSYFFTASK